VVRKKKTFRGWTGISSLASGQGDNAVHGRFRYRLRRDDSNAAGLAEWAILALVEAKIVARSLIRCGRFPVFSSCSITAMTMSSLIPSVSTFRPGAPSFGDAGGVYPAAALDTIFAVGWSIEGEPALERGEETGDRGSSPSWERFTFFVGGEEVEESAGGVGVLRDGRCAREPLGRWMPSEGKESDFRRVL
jgi:hypothetical protein